MERVTYRNEENGWTVLRARAIDQDSTLTATGHFPQVRSGEQFEWFGAWTNHAQYGRQFKIERAVPIRPTGREAIERYLASGLIKGIGPKTAARIVDHFGDETLEVLDKTPQRLVEVPSMGAKKVQGILESWETHRRVSDVMMFLNGHGVSPLFAARIYKTYGKEAIEIVSADPYRLAVDIHGIGFVSADRIAQHMGIPLDSPERMRAAILYQVRQAEERGHCFVTTTQLAELLSACLNLESSQVHSRLRECLSYLENLGAIITEPHQDDSGSTQAHYRADLLAAECSLADHIGTLLKTPLAAEETRVESWIARYIEASGTTLSDEQLDAVRKAAAHRVFILTGGPGVGKTTTANAIIRLLKAMGKTVMLGAPTGRAAQRLTEVAAAPARTIHRMLEWVPNMGTFARDEENPLTVQAVVIDEASMLDVRLADALIRAIPKTAQVILIGDVDQLPSVGPGNVLRDLLRSQKIPCTKLQKIFRQASFSSIVQTAHSINQGDDVHLDGLGNRADSDCRFIDATTVDELRDSIRSLVTKELPKMRFDPLADVQILTPMNRGDLGTVSLNAELQELLNPPKPGKRQFRRGQTTFRIGDKVIQSANNYEISVFNGDIGFVEDCGIEGGKVVVRFGDRMVVYDEEQTMDLRLAYAITIHKSQGSEFKAVILPCSMQHYVMLQRNLMYTGLTRAKKLAIFIGTKKALHHAVRNQESQLRQTRLVERLRDSAS